MMTNRIFLTVFSWGTGNHGFAEAAKLTTACNLFPSLSIGALLFL